MGWNRAGRKVGRKGLRSKVRHAEKQVRAGQASTVGGACLCPQACKRGAVMAVTLTTPIMSSRRLGARSAGLMETVALMPVRPVVAFTVTVSKVAMARSLDEPIWSVGRVGGADGQRPVFDRFAAQEAGSGSS